MIHPQIALIFSPHSWSIVNFHFIDWLLLLWSDQSPLLPRQPRPLQRSRTPRVRLVTKVENRSLGLWWPAICKRLIPSTAARRRARRRIGIPPSFSPSLFLSLSSLLSLPPFYPSLHSLSWIRRMWHCSHSLLVSGEPIHEREVREGSLKADPGVPPNCSHLLFLILKDCHRWSISHIFLLPLQRFGRLGEPTSVLSSWQPKIWGGGGGYFLIQQLKSFCLSLLADFSLIVLTLLLTCTAQDLQTLKKKIWSLSSYIW